MHDCVLQPFPFLFEPVASYPNAPTLTGVWGNPALFHLINRTRKEP
ncbi:hypothetical protein PHLH6_14460 [Pseudomonas sp. Seg1]|nr:hypothetical protein PHLH6_14460 [Pseudomonas sp. Seg1]